MFLFNINVHCYERYKQKVILFIVHLVISVTDISGPNYLHG